MTQYIDKDTLVSEIERKIDILIKNSGCIGVFGENQITVYEDILSLINTLEVKEVDLEKEINKYISDNFFGSETMGFFTNRTKGEPDDQDIALCAQHFFKLGLKATQNKV